MHGINAARRELDLGQLVLGTMTFGGQVAERTAREMVAVAREAGVTMVDTSNNYAGGVSEEIVGRVIAPFRDQIVLATKGGSHVDQTDASVKGLGRAALRAAVAGSLRRLGTDRIDVYYLHRPDPMTPFEETLGALDELVREGKIRYVGQSNFAAWQVTEMVAIARREGWPAPLISQAMYNLLGRRIEAEYTACAKYLDLTTIVYNPLAGGLLTGKHREDAEPPAGSRFSRQIYRDRYWHPTLFAAVGRLSELADGAGLSLVELALRWVAHRPATDAVLLGASSLEQLRRNVSAVSGGPLPDDVLEACDEIWTDVGGPAPHYNR